MSVATAPRSQRRSRPLVTLPLVMATALAAASGAALGIALAPDEPERPAPPRPAPPRIGMESGVARLPLPAGWEPLRRLSKLPGLEQATAVRAEHAEVALDIRPPENASLLPASVVAAAGSGLSDPEPRSVDGRTAWRYELPGRRPESQLVALALPTTGGVVTFACQPRAASIIRADSECAKAVGAVRLNGAAALTPTPETAARIALPATVAQLNRSRGSDRRRLAAARWPQRRSAVALRLSRAYAAAAERLRPLAGGDALGLTSTLDTLASQHRVLARGSRWRNARTARRAGAAIVRGERRLSALLAALTGARAGP